MKDKNRLRRLCVNHIYKVIYHSGEEIMMKAINYFDLARLLVDRAETEFTPTKIAGDMVGVKEVWLKKENENRWERCWKIGI